MRKRSLFPFPGAAGVLAALGIASGVAGGHPSPATPPDVTATPPAVAGPAGPGLGRLAALAGRWTVRQSMWTDPDGPPAIDHGTATFTPVLGGRHLRQELRIGAAAAPFEGLGYLGYDDATGTYDSLWMDVNFAGVILAHGSYDAARQAYTFIGAVPDPQHRGATRPLREVMRVRDADHFSFDYYERRGARERLAVRLEYARMR